MESWKGSAHYSSLLLVWGLITFFVVSFYHTERDNQRRGFKLCLWDSSTVTLGFQFLPGALTSQGLQFLLFPHFTPNTHKGGNVILPHFFFLSQTSFLLPPRAEKPPWPPPTAPRCSQHFRDTSARQPRGYRHVPSFNQSHY